jgi:hypothetical protein
MNSRWSTHPIKRGGEIVSIRPNVAGDIEILKCLGRYTVLTAQDIAALTKRSYGAVIARLNLLKRKPHELIRVHATQMEQPRVFQWSPQVFHLTPPGISKLRDMGFEPSERSSKQFIHQITESQTAASFEVGARAAGLEHIVLPLTPIPVSFSYKGKDYREHHIIPDGGIIGLGYAGDLYRFMVFETDCATEPLESSNRDRQTIETKFAAYLTLFESGLYKQWDIPDLCLTVLFTTLSKTRMNSMRDLLASMSDKYLSYFGFQTFGTILSSGDKPEPGWAVTRPWNRVKSPLNLGEA